MEDDVKSEFQDVYAMMNKQQNQIIKLIKLVEELNKMV